MGWFSDIVDTVSNAVSDVGSAIADNIVPIGITTAAVATANPELLALDGASAATGAAAVDGFGLSTGATSLELTGASAGSLGLTAADVAASTGGYLAGETTLANLGAIGSGLSLTDVLSNANKVLSGANSTAQLLSGTTAQKTTPVYFLGTPSNTSGNSPLYLSGTPSAQAQQPVIGSQGQQAQTAQAISGNYLIPAVLIGGMILLTLKLKKA